jgi:hypothetical protein
LQSSDDLAYTQQWQRQEYEQNELDHMQRAAQVTTNKYIFSLIYHLNNLNINVG